MAKVTFMEFNAPNDKVAQAARAALVNSQQLGISASCEPVLDEPVCTRYRMRMQKKGTVQGITQTQHIAAQNFVDGYLTAVRQVMLTFGL